MIDTASSTGMSQILSSAGSSLADNVTNILNEKKHKNLDFFDPGGQELNDALRKVTGAVNYRLLHRTIWKTKHATDYNNDHYELRQDKHGNIRPYYAGKPLLDGAWILLRITREDKYGLTRPWFNSVRERRNDVNALFRSWSAGNDGDRDKVGKMLSSREKDSLRQQLLSQATIIENDGVLSRQERNNFSANIVALLKVARIAFKNNDPGHYLSEQKKIKFT